MSKIVLCVEDNIQVQMINKPLLEAKGFTVKMAMNLYEARTEVNLEMPSLIILDIHLPDGNGLDFLRELRGTSMIPVIALTNNKEERDIVEGLASGCDDYIPKPYTFPILYARIEALLRRAEHIPQSITKGALTLRVSSNQAFVNGKDIGLSKDIEFSILCIFADNENRFLSAEFLYEQAWGQPMLGSDSALRNAIYKLRKKLEGSGYVITGEYGKGYCFERG